MADLREQLTAIAERVYEVVGGSGSDNAVLNEIERDLRALAAQPAPSAPNEYIRFDFKSDGRWDSIMITHDDMRQRYADACSAAYQPAPASVGADAEALIRECVPGGSICDPQQVADSIREYFRRHRGRAG